jgi:hypothetical protein
MTAVRILETEIEAVKTLVANLRDLIGDDERVLNDMISGETDLDLALDKIAEALVMDLVHAEALKELVKRFEERQHRIEQRIGHMKELVRKALELTGRKSHRAPAGSFVRVSTRPAVIIVDESEVPFRFFKPVAPRVSKSAIACRHRGR